MKTKTIVFSTFLVALFSITLISGCKKEDDDKLTGRDAIIGTYDFTNNYTLYNWNDALQQVDTVRGTQTYVITIDKPNPDNLGENVVIITNLLKKQSTEIVHSTLSSAGDVLSYTVGWSSVEFYAFQGVKDGNNINFNFTAYGGGTPDGISESGSGTAVKR